MEGWETVIDSGSTADQDAGRVSLVGLWIERSSSESVNGNFFHDGASGNGNRYVEFDASSALPAAGLYGLAISYTTSNTRATNTPVLVSFPGGQFEIAINQKSDPQADGFAAVGSAVFAPGATAKVRITNLGTDGKVIVDACRWRWLGFGNAPPATADTTPETSETSSTTPDPTPSTTAIPSTTTTTTTTQAASTAAVSTSTPPAAAPATIVVSYLDPEADIIGNWESINPIGTGVHDNNNGKGHKLVRFALDALPLSGTYTLAMSWRESRTRATNVPVWIFYDDPAEGSGTEQVALTFVDQKQAPPADGFFVLGDFPRPLRVEIRNDGTDGKVIADRIRLQYVGGGLEEQPDTSTSTKATSASTAEAGPTTAQLPTSPSTTATPPTAPATTTTTTTAAPGGGGSTGGGTCTFADKLIFDDTDAVFYGSGWATVSCGTDIDYCHGTDFRHSKRSEAADKRAVFDLVAMAGGVGALPGGAYEVSIKYSVSTTRSTAVPIRITESDGDQTLVYVDQTSAPNGLDNFHSLGMYISPVKVSNYNERYENRKQ